MIEYIIDGLNRRIGKKVKGVVTRKWLYQNQLNPTAELDSNNSVLSRFVYGTKINCPDYIVKGDSTYKVITDQLGSARMIVNSISGNVVQEIEYDEYGNVLSQSSTFEIPFGFAGGLYDGQTKLTRFGARDYDSEIGRWTAKDPILFGGGVSNLYEYCVNDPVNCYDPSGLWDKNSHWNLTYYAMTASGFTGADVITAINANTNTDRFDNQWGYYGNSAHYMPGYIMPKLERYF